MKDCVSLEIARRLKEAGWKQEARDYFCTDVGEQTYSQCCAVQFKKATCGHHIALASIGELLEALGNNLTFIRNNIRSWRVYDGDGPVGNMHEHINLADALALLWMALKEKGIV